MARKIFITLLFLFFIFPSSVLATNYYVSTSGSDANLGTTDGPFRTIQKAANTVVAGDIVLVRSGTYNERVVVGNSGTQSAPIIIKADPLASSRPVISGVNLTYNSNVSLNGDWIIFEGFEVLDQSQADSALIWVNGNHNIIRNNKAHYSQGRGIFVGGNMNPCGDINSTRSNYNIIEDNEVWDTSRKTINDRAHWSTAVVAARCPRDTIIRRNIVHDTFGIGIGPYESYNNLVEDNIVYNNAYELFYLNNAPGSTLQRNFAYITSGASSILQQIGKTNYGPGIAFCDEKTAPVTSNVKIINNLVLNTKGFYFFNQVAGSGLKNFLIANNIFANVQSTYNYTSFQINNGVHENSRIENNIIDEETSFSIANVATNQGLTFANNLWSKTPPSTAVGTGDIIGNPQLAKTGTVQPGQLTAQWFKILSSSPARDHALRLAEVTEDYFRASRGTSPDIGAHEYTGVTSTPTPISTPTPVTGQFRFISWGDGQGGYTYMTSGSNQANALNPTPRFAIFNGDFERAGFTTADMDSARSAINGGSITNGNGMYDKTFLVRGNHDNEATNSASLWQSYVDIAGVVSRVGATNYVPYSSDLTYSFDYGNSRFIGVDVPGTSSNLTSAQISWVDQRLTDAEVRGLVHAFIFFHGPVYPVSNYSSCTTITGCVSSQALSLVDVISRHPIVSATFNGHEHVLAWAHIDSSRIPGVVNEYEQFHTSAVGASSYVVDLKPNRVDWASTLDTRGFAAVDVSGPSFTINFYSTGNTTSLRTLTFTESGTLTPTLTPTPTVILCARKGEGDADCDGIINILDFETWRREFLGIDTTTKADFDGSGGVTILDFEIWRRGFLK